MSEDLDLTHILPVSGDADEDDPGATYQLVAPPPPRSLKEPSAEVREAMERDAIDVEHADLSNEYHLGRLIGKGGQGEVWEALQLRLGRRVAIKRAVKKSENVAEFLKEAYTSAQLDHPNIVPVYDLGTMEVEGEHVPVLSMKKVTGKSWNELIKADRNSHSRASFLSRHLPIFIDVMHAVNFAHAHNVIHRDLKPSQVMVGDFGEVFLLDWGLGIYLPENDEEAASEEEVDPNRFFTLDTATNPAGSPSYMAPEQARFDTAFLGKHTDIYLLGAVLFELVAGEPPHRGGSFKEVFHKVAMNSCIPLPDHAPDDLREIIHKCMYTDPGDRPESVSEIIEAVEKYLTGAGRIDASRKITNEIAATEMETLKDYESLSDISRKLGQASHLWPENPELETARSRVLGRYVIVALEFEDFIIAQLQAERVQDERLHRELAERIEAARDKAAAELPIPPLFTGKRLSMMAIVCILIVASIWTVSSVAEQAIRDEVYNSVKSIATVAANEIKSSDLETIDAERDMYSGDFQRVLNQLNAFRRANDDIRYLGTLRPEAALNGSTWRVLVDADPMDVDLNQDGEISPKERGAPPGSLLEDAPQEMQTAYRESRAIGGIASTDRGQFISGFAPVMDPRKSNPVAIVRVDVSLAEFNDKTRVLRAASIGAAIVLILLATASFFAYFASRRSLKRIQLLEAAVKKQSSELSSSRLYLG